MIAREKDRERHRLKRMDPEYRALEKERDRNRRRAKRAHEALTVLNFAFCFYLPNFFLLL